MALRIWKWLPELLVQGQYYRIKGNMGGLVKQKTEKLFDEIPRWAAGQENHDLHLAFM